MIRPFGAQALHEMMDVYYKPLRDAQFKLQPILHEHDIDTMFGKKKYREIPKRFLM
jgi:hypothetical protein